MREAPGRHPTDAGSTITEPAREAVQPRAGDNSLHPHWLAGDGDHTWYLVVSYFGDDPDIFKVGR